MYVYTVGTGMCFGKLSKPGPAEDNKLNFSAKLLIGMTVFDPVVIITGLAAGILGVLCILPLPAAAAYALIGVGGAFLLTYVLAAAATKGEIFDIAKMVWTHALTPSEKTKGA